MSDGDRRIGRLSGTTTTSDDTTPSTIITVPRGIFAPGAPGVGMVDIILLAYDNEDTAGLGGWRAEDFFIFDGTSVTVGDEPTLTALSGSLTGQNLTLPTLDGVANSNDWDFTITSADDKFMRWFIFLDFKSGEQTDPTP